MTTEMKMLLEVFTAQRDFDKKCYDECKKEECSLVDWIEGRVSVWNSVIEELEKQVKKEELK